MIKVIVSPHLHTSSKGDDVDRGPLKGTGLFAASSNWFSARPPNQIWWCLFEKVKTHDFARAERVQA